MLLAQLSGGASREFALHIAEEDGGLVWAVPDRSLKGSWRDRGLSVQEGQKRGVHMGE